MCMGRSSRNSWLEAMVKSLNLMNDVTYIEAARMFAQRMLSQSGATPIGLGGKPCLIPTHALSPGD